MSQSTWDQDAQVTIAGLTVSGATISVNSKIMTPPAASGTLATTGNAETLTNKTLTSPALTTPTLDVANALTALGTSRANALALTATVNNLTTVGASTGVILPPSVVGKAVIIFNAGASPLAVYGNGSDTIDTIAGATGVVLTNAKRCIYFCVAANTYISAQLGVVSA